VLNKCDLAPDVRMRPNEKLVAGDTPLFYTSALDGSGVIEAFRGIAQDILRRGL